MAKESVAEKIKRIREMKKESPPEVEKRKKELEDLDKKLEERKRQLEAMDDDDEDGQDDTEDSDEEPEEESEDEPEVKKPQKKKPEVTLDNYIEEMHNVGKYRLEDLNFKRQMVLVLNSIAEKMDELISAFRGEK